jgi:hypothetical protein
MQHLHIIIIESNRLGFGNKVLPRLSCLTQQKWPAVEQLEARPLMHECRRDRLGVVDTRVCDVFADTIELLSTLSDCIKLPRARLGCLSPNKHVHPSYKHVGKRLSSLNHK